MLEENTIIVLKPQGLSLLEVVQVARKGAKVVLSEELKEKINQSRQLVEKMIEQKRVVYGITTGFGKFATVTIGPEDTRALQHNLIVSHAVGVGKPLPEETVRAMMLLRAYSLSRGYSGIRLTTIQALLDALNAGIHRLYLKREVLVPVAI
jgi:histidine ammonia-lyase